MRLLRTPAAAVLALALPALASTGTDTLWIADDTEKKIYHVTLTGSLITSFDHVNGANSSVSVDPVDGSLWGIDESPPRVVNYTTEGDFVDEFTISGATALEGVGVDPDGSLWVVNDPKSGDVPSVFHLSKVGSLLDSFETADYSNDSISPQDVDVDKLDGTLWITDNSADRIFHVSRTGTLLGSIDTDEFGGPGNVQGISAAQDGTLWVTARDTSEIYHITTSGSVISSFDSNTYSGDSDDPTGVGFSPGRPAADPWEDVGGGTVGSEGPPTLVMGGPLTAGSTVTLDLTDAPDDALCILFISFTSTPTPFLGGTLHTFPFDLIGSMFADGSGEFSGSSPFDGGSSGTELWLQMGIDDPDVPIWGASLSNAVKGTLP